MHSIISGIFSWVISFIVSVDILLIAFWSMIKLVEMILNVL